MNLVYKVKRIIEKENLIEKGDSVLIGVSGGADSTALLNVLFEISKQIGFKPGIVHLNHLLRGEESDGDERFVEELAHTLSLPFYVKKFDVKGYAEEHGISIQHAGRNVRYDFFEEIADKHGFNKIAVAHNLDDQVETFLLRTLKGTGIRGLSSIPLKRGRIIRPFLGIYRFEIEDYAKENSLRYVEDSSNSKVLYERNYIRKHITPLMEKVNPLFKEKIVLLLEDLTAMNDLYDAKAEDFLKKEKRKEEGDIFFETDALRGIDEEVRFRVVANVFAQIKPDFIPLREHIRLINKVLTSRRPNSMLVMPSGIKVKKSYNKFIFTKRPALAKFTDVLPISIGENRMDALGFTLDVSILKTDKRIEHQPDKYSAYLDGDKAGSLSARTFSDGDRFFPLGMNNSIKLKDFFISQKIPREERRRVPLLVSGNDIIWVIGHRIDERYKITERTKKVLKVAAKRN